MPPHGCRQGSGETSFIATTNGSLDPFHDPRSFGQKEPDANHARARSSGCISVLTLRTLDPLDKSQTGIADQRGLTRRCRSNRIHLLRTVYFGRVAPELNILTPGQNFRDAV